MLTYLTSILLLPIYTTYLRPEDYGVIAILDLVANILGILIGAGMAAAVTRYHFEARDSAEQSEVWWTGLTFVVMMATGISGGAWLLRDGLASVTLGHGIESGPFYYTFIIATLWFSTVAQLPNAYLRIRKWSGLYVGINLVRVVLNIGLNLTFLIVLQLGVLGILMGNLIAGGVYTLLLLGVSVKGQGQYVCRRSWLKKLLIFGVPLIVTALLSSLMHHADRYILRIYLDMHQVGIYSFAYTIGQAVNTLCLLPFAMIWGIAIYEIAPRPDAKEIYARVFEYFVYGLALIILGVSLFARPLLSLLINPDYLAAADLIPIVLLAYLLFSLHEHFKVPALLAKRTDKMLSAYVLATATNFGVNLIFIPWFGSTGAGWASVITFGVFSFTGLWRYRHIDRYKYPFAKCSIFVGGMIGTFIVYKVSIGWATVSVESVVTASVIWTVWAGITFFMLVGQLSRKQTNLSDRFRFLRSLWRES